MPLLLDVQFVAYTSCPALVIVRDGSGKKIRVQRDDLYTSGDFQNVVSKNKLVDVSWSNT